MTRGTRGSHSCNMWPIFVSRFYSIERGTQLLSVLKNQRSVLKINDTVFVGKQFSSKRYFGHQILPQIPEISSNSTKSRAVIELDSFFLYNLVTTRFIVLRVPLHLAHEYFRSSSQRMLPMQ